MVHLKPFLLVFKHQNDDVVGWLARWFANGTEAAPTEAPTGGAVINARRCGSAPLPGHEKCIVVPSNKLYSVEETHKWGGGQ